MNNTAVTDARIMEDVTLVETGRVSVSLSDGLDLGQVRYVRAVLRQLNAGDILAAQEEAERLVYAKDGTLSLVMSPARMGREALRRQITKLEAEDGQQYDGPLSVEELARLSGRDLAAVQTGAELLDAAVVAAQRLTNGDSSAAAAARSAEALRDRGRSAAGHGDSAAAGDDGSPQNRHAV